MKGILHHTKRGAIALLVTGLVAIVPLSQAADQAAETFDPASNAKTRTLVDELAARGLDRDWLDLAMRQAEFRPGVLEAMTGAAERRLRWDEYRNIFIKPERIREGAAFIEAHREAFDRAQAEYGVAPEIIAAIIGVETFYGRYTGKHRVIDSLATLAFHHPSRGDFFRGELAAFLEITSQQNVDPLTLEGSYAGAMGFPQFIPTSYQAYAVDFDGDGKRDLWHNPVDAIGSVGNYFARHGWRAGAAIVSEAQGPAARPDGVEFNRTRKPYASVAALADKGIQPAGGEALDGQAQVIPLALDFGDGSTRYALGHDNFYVITRYNHSHLYAMAVTTLAERIHDTLEAEA
ncbi:membrane-bound lytic murein transglycosylase B [Modicisalibacter ilicicola DSM 19980]|uniref:Membrane-bound lytic murein transglycosylase B n=1 Tax=Modicisalibacter ilicicola DSM 19980 TaxID=1121942 RepID=A0A1M5BU57_9GAMM|nr:lytic murein transglycosylase B [Halomonas ilicicola]SHF46069.1 membrane-bound lytic murein transglycosylase B [Halomonas ilicicola DSM 19980]